MVCLGLYAVKGKAQISAEAQGGQITLWTAVGIDQELSKRWTSVTELGYGRHSDPNNFDIAKRLGLNVIMQNFVYRINEHFKAALSFGYWRRNAYTDIQPFDSRPYPYQWRNEFRPYMKFYYDFKLNKIRVSNTLRFDYRFYYNQNLTDRWTTPFEFRARIMTNWHIPLDEEEKNWFLWNDEVMGSTFQYNAINARIKGHKWTNYIFTENRLSAYYRRRAFGKKIDIDLGLMYQYWRDKIGDNAFNNSLNMMADVILRDPFHWHKAKS